ncbi:response regulator [Phototrophicus methaneseepsis]|uniref:Response regulator n=1 Tax=Phototrophicus methaneseepsis TaxID=2710758 RepID=A0A7S8EAK3_9CHLR|nr:response regulator [Phototrophicus methaneseepsis]QPC83288.1 response regulator [Phototrophicus methaneseepsis]
MSKIPVDLLMGWDIVVVDDEPDSLEVARYILDFYGANVYTATNGKEGLDLVEEVRPRFVISDLSMPIMDGWEFLSNLKSTGYMRDIPVIALTAHAMKGDRERAIAVGFHNYLTKPLTAHTFMDELLVLLLDIPQLSEYLTI